MPSKKDLLRTIEEIELKRINELTLEELQQEIVDWFQCDVGKRETRADLTNDLLEDYMRYRQDESEQELQDLLEELTK